MKILKIKIKNINCLRSEWEINFQVRPLSEAGLFAITGPTGSGKSTILDSITLALFNKVPRFESETISNTFIEKAGSIVTRNETDCFAEVDYSCARGIYRSKWTIATNKRGNLRANDMELIDLATNKIIAQGKRDVPANNKELIGLSYDQFIKSILLSQGEFARFLKSKMDERGKLLEDITGMTVYRSLGRRAFEKFKEKNDVIKSRIDIIDSEESQLLSPENENELEKLIFSLNKDIHDSELLHATIEKTIEIKTREQAIVNEIEKYKQEQEQISETLNDFNKENAHRIGKHERLLPYLAGIRNYANIHHSRKAITEEMKKEEVELKAKRIKAEEKLKAIGKFTGSEVDISNAIDVLTNFRDRVIYLLTNKLSAEKALENYTSKISTYLKKPTLAQFRAYGNANKIQELRAKVEREHAANAAKIQNLLEQINIKPGKIAEQKEFFNTRLKAMEDLKLQVENYIEIREKRRQRKEEIKEASEFIEGKNPQLHKITALKKSIGSQINAVIDKREKKLRENSFEEERKILKSGDPCPLCGSLHHPYIHEYLDNISELTKEYQKLQEDERTCELQLEELQSKINRYAGILDIQEKESRTIEKEMQVQEIKIAERKKQLAIDKVGNLQPIEAAIADLDQSVKAISDLEKLNDTKRDLDDFKEAAGEFALRREEYEKAKKEVDSRYRGTAIRQDCDTLASQLNQSTDAIQNIEANISSYQRQLADLNKQQVKIDASLTNSLIEFGYPDILSSSADILPDEEFSGMKNQQSELEGNINRIKALMEGAIERKQQLRKTDHSNKSKEELSDELNAIQENLEQYRKDLSENHAQKIQNEKRKNKIKELKKQVDETRQANLKWDLLCKYIGDATGKNFSTFAQGLTLKKLIILTNEQLRRLNDRYLLDIPLEEEDDDLVIIDTYLGEERRSIKTLSGGETFIVSLALALALSDLASKNVKIESLYIDEGFGSLDQDALEVAISTLEQLQMESNKTIGIISHIDSLKERIETQIKLEKNQSGFSKIVIE